MSALNVAAEVSVRPNPDNPLPVQMLESGKAIYKRRTLALAT